MRQKEKKKIVPAPPCEWECVQCDIGRHCGRQPLCQHVFGPKLRKEPEKKRCRTNFLTLFLIHPLNKNGLKFFRSINTFLNRQGIHGINRGHESFVSAGHFQSVFKAHILAPRPEFLGRQNNPAEGSTQLHDFLVLYICANPYAAESDGSLARCRTVLNGDKLV